MKPNYRYAPDTLIEKQTKTFMGINHDEQTFWLEKTEAVIGINQDRIALTNDRTIYMLSMIGLIH